MRDEINSTWEALKLVPFHFTAFLVVLVMGSISILNRLKGDRTSSWRVFVAEAVITLFTAVLMAVILGSVDLPNIYVVLIAVIGTRLLDSILKSIDNIGSRLQQEAPNYFDTAMRNLVERYTKKRDEIEPITQPPTETQINTPSDESNENK